MNGGLTLQVALNGVYGIVLASGESKRMGKPKLLLQWKGVTLIEHILNKVAIVPFDEVKVVIPDQNETLHRIVSSFEYTVIQNMCPQKGLGNSLSLAVTSLPASSEAAIILLGDQPTISSEDIKRVWLTFMRIRWKQQYCPKIIIQMKYRDGKVGHPILFSKHFFEELQSLRGDQGGKDIICSNSQFIVRCYSGHVYPNDIDTPYDFSLLVEEGEEC